jgi:hypothetical protein
MDFNKLTSHDRILAVTLSTTDLRGIYNRAVAAAGLTRLQQDAWFQLVKAELIKRGVAIAEGQFEV